MLKFLTTLCSVLCTGLMASAMVPATLNYQGLLADSAGSPIPDSSYSLTFRLFGTPTGGTPLWIESHSAVAVSAGLFDVLLGSDTPLDLDFDQPLYLSISLDGEAEFVPRKPLSASPYSLNTRDVDGGYVRSLNTLQGDVRIIGGTNVSVNSAGDSVQISATAAGAAVPVVATTRHIGNWIIYVEPNYITIPGANVTINCPGPGTIVVQATVTICALADPFAYPFWLVISPTQNDAGQPADIREDLVAGGSTGTTCANSALLSTFTVPSAGSRTYYVNARRSQAGSAGNLSYRSSIIVATWYPNP